MKIDYYMVYNMMIVSKSDNMILTLKIYQTTNLMKTYCMNIILTNVWQS